MTLVRDLHDRIDNEGRMRFDRWKIEHGFTDDPEWHDLPEGGPDRVRFYNDVLADETLSLVELPRGFRTLAEIDWQSPLPAASPQKDKTG